MFNIIDINSAWKADLVIRKERPFSVEELARRSVQRVAETDVPTASAEDTIVAKLEWAKAGNSSRQIADVAGILRLRGDALDGVYLARWIDELELRDEWEQANALR